MTQPKPLPALSWLNEHFYHDDCLRWRIKVNRGRGGIFLPGDPVVFCLHEASGYGLIMLQRKLHKFHRLVWAICNQADPYPLQIDHKDRNRLNNDPSNLRLATNGQNGANSARLRTKSPYRGVQRTFAKAERWKGYINVNGKRTYTPSFDTPEEARDARNQLAAVLHGDFATDL